MVESIEAKTIDLPIVVEPIEAKTIDQPIVVEPIKAKTGRYKSRTGLWSGSDQVGLGRIFRKFRNFRIFREICILSRVIYTA